MNTKELSPEKSLELITKVIEEAKERVEENGLIYVLWGVLIATASIGQFILLKMEYYSVNWYPYLLMPIGAIVTAFYSRNERPKNAIGKMMTVAWVILSLNIMILGFAFGYVLKTNLIPVILMLLSLGIQISGVSVKSKLLIFSGIFINISALICFWVEWLYQPLVMGIVSIFAILIPGIILMLQYKKK